MSVAVIAALPREVKGLVGSSRAEERDGISVWRLGVGVVVTAGMGAERAALAVGAALATGGVTELVSAGLAGACVPALRAGEIAEAGVVVDAATGERYGSEGLVLATTPVIASVGEKARLAATYGASLVDMEAATVARLARAHGLGFRAVKGISDAHDFELEGLGKFAGPRGTFRTGAFALHTALRPGMWGKAMTLGRGSTEALVGLTEKLREILA